MMAIARAIQVAARTTSMSNWHTDNYITSANTNDLVYYLYDEIGNRPVEGPVPQHGALVVPPHVTGAYANIDSLGIHPYTLPHVQFRLADNEDDEYHAPLDTSITAGKDLLLRLSRQATLEFWATDYPHGPGNWETQFKLGIMICSWWAKNAIPPSKILDDTVLTAA